MSILIRSLYVFLVVLSFGSVIQAEDKLIVNDASFGATFQECEAINFENGRTKIRWLKITRVWSDGFSERIGLKQGDEITRFSVWGSSSAVCSSFSADLKAIETVSDYIRKHPEGNVMIHIFNGENDRTISFPASKFPAREP